MHQYSHEWTKKAKRDLIILMQALISIKEAQTIVSSHLPRLNTETLPAADTPGRILAAPITADRAIPPYDRVMMDGIAIHHESFIQGRRDFKITGIQAAGQPALSLASNDQCLEVMTGAMLPEGTDCVIKIEDIIIDDDTAYLPGEYSVQQGQNIHPQASDQKQGARLVAENTILGPAEIAIATSVGQLELSVIRQPNILLITTGDEVITPEQTPLQHQIRRSHAAAIIPSIQEANLGKVENIHVPDTPESLKETLHSGLEKYDLILLTGGISMGKYDYVAPVMQSLVGDPKFHGIAQKPGKPFAFWPGAPPVFALPGNPVSVMACLARYILPALRQMRGESWKPTAYPLANDTTWKAPFPGLVASQLSANQIVARPPRNSGDYTALAGAQGICELPATSLAGTTLNFYPW